MDITRYPIAAFHGLQLKTPAADKLRWGLEDAIHGFVAAGGVTGVELAIAQLNRGGHTLAIREAGDTYREYRGLVANGSVLLSVTVLVNGDLASTGVTFEPTAPILRSPAELAAAAMQERFFDQYDAVSHTSMRAARRLAPAGRIVFCCGSLLTDMSNGGFSHHFWNTRMTLAEDTLATLWAINAADVAGVFSRAMELAPDIRLTGQPLMQALARMDRQHQRPLERLDEQFYASGDDLPVLAMAFMG